MDFWYDNQTKRYLLQIQRVFQDFKIETRYGNDKIQTKVPIIYGDMSHIAAMILKGASENTMMPAPMFSFWIRDIAMAPERRHDPMFEGKINAIERKWDGEKYLGEVGNRYTIDRYMPVPYNMSIVLDLWTTSTTHKFQLIEQIKTLFNPGIQLQQTDSEFDWTAIFEMEMVSTTFSNRGMPQGGDQERDVWSAEFLVPIWYNPPAKVRRAAWVEQIVVNVNEAAAIEDVDGALLLDDPAACLGWQRIDQIIVTPGQHRVGIGIDGLGPNEIRLLTAHGLEDESLSWVALFEEYGNIEANETRMRLKLDSDIEVDDFDILGTVKLDPNRADILIFEVDKDTLPRTLDGGPVKDIIDPQVTFPGVGVPAPVAGDRYLMIGDMTDGEEGVVADDGGRHPWGGLVAWEGDIVEWNGREWFVAFDASENSGGAYVVNLRSMNHYRYDGTQWVYTYMGDYFPGYWRMENLSRGADWDEESGDLVGDFPECVDVSGGGRDCFNDDC